MTKRVGTLGERQPMSWFNLPCAVLITKPIDILLVTLHLTTSFLPGTKRCVTPPETRAACSQKRCKMESFCYSWLSDVQLWSFPPMAALFWQNRRDLCLFLFHYCQDELNRVIAGERLSVSEMASPALEREMKCMKGFYRQSALLST